MMEWNRTERKGRGRVYRPVAVRGRTLSLTDPNGMFLSFHSGDTNIYQHGGATMNTTAEAISDIMQALAGQVEALDTGALEQWQRTLVLIVAATMRCMGDMLRDGLAVEAEP